MPVETDSDLWLNSETSDLAHKRVLEFLEDNPNQAFRIREIADEIIDTQWAAREEETRLRQEVGEDEFFQNKEEYREQLDEIQESIKRDMYHTNRLKIWLDYLQKEGEVEARSIPGDQIDVPYDRDFIGYYTLADE